MVLWRLLPWFILVVACKNTTSTPENMSNITETQPITSTVLVATVDHLRLRLKPEGTSDVVHTLREGESILWQGEQSDHLETVSLRGNEVKAPWYFVKTAKGLEGWGFSGGMETWVPGRGLPYQECIQTFNSGDLSGFYPCLDRISHTISGPEKVAVTPTYIRLKLSSGENRQLNHIQTPGDDYRLYQYLGLLSSFNVYVVKVNRQGGSSFLLVHAQTGQMLDVAGIPQPLPMSISLFCFGATPNSPGDYTLQVINTSARQLNADLEQDYPNQSLAGIQWGTDGLPALSLRDHLGNLVTWKLNRKAPDQWALVKVN